MDLVNIMLEEFKEHPVITTLMGLAGASSVGLLRYAIFGKYTKSGKSLYGEWILRREQRRQQHKEKYESR